MPAEPPRLVDLTIEEVTQPNSFKHYAIRCGICTMLFRVTLILDDDLFETTARCPRCGNAARMTTIQSSMRRRLLMERERQRAAEDAATKQSGLSVGRVIDIDGKERPT